MVIGRNDPRLAKNTGLKEAIEIGLDEALTALEESIHDLTEEQVAALPIPGRNNIAWIVMHSLDNLDTYGNAVQTGKRAFPHEWRWDLWECTEDERPKPEDTFPSQHEMADRLKAVGSAVVQGLSTATADDLKARRRAPDWWKHTSADACMRTISHTMAHVRQIWLLRGALGLTDGRSWPQQHWA